MRVWAAAEPSFTRPESASDSGCGRITNPVQWGSSYTGWTAILQEKSMAGCWISDLALNFTFRDPEVAPKRGRETLRSLCGVSTFPVQNYQVCLFLGLGPVWEGEMSRGVRAGEGERRETELWAPIALQHCTGCSHSWVFPGLPKSHRVGLKHCHTSRWELWADVLLCTASAALLDSVVMQKFFL